jgi:phage terminase large subunit-like protein
MHVPQAHNPGSIAALFADPRTATNPFLGQFDYNQLPGFTPEMDTFQGRLEEFEEILELYEYADERQRREIDLLLRSQGGPENALLPHQIVPFQRDDWEVMALEGGRGTGKTVCGATACVKVLRAQKKAADIFVGGPTNTDVRNICLEGPTGLYTLYAKEFKSYSRSLGQMELIHRDGGRVLAMGTERPKRWNGGNWTWGWFDEYALCNKDSIADANLALRGGPKTGPWRARMLVTFTPKGQVWTRDLMKKPTTYVPRYIGPDGKPRRPTTFDNPYLPQRRVEVLKTQFLGTRLGNRELLGIEVFGVPGALWRPGIIKHVTDPEQWPLPWLRVVVAIDPAGTSARRKADENSLSEKERLNLEKRAKTSICVKAKGRDGRNYTLAWVAGHWTPTQWAQKAVQYFRAYKADRIVAEKNFGGEMVESTLRQVWADAPITLVNASDGKRQRAEPVVALEEQGKEIHCLVFPEGESQCCAFIDSDHNEGADYVDSYTWATWELMGWNDVFGAYIVGQRDDLASGLIGVVAM